MFGFDYYSAISPSSGSDDTTAQNVIHETRDWIEVVSAQIFFTLSLSMSGILIKQGAEDQNCPVGTSSLFVWSHFLSFRTIVFWWHLLAETWIRLVPFLQNEHNMYPSRATIDSFAKVIDTCSPPKLPFPSHFLAVWEPYAMVIWRVMTTSLHS